MAIQTISDLEQPAADIARFVNRKIAENKKVLWLVAGGSSIKLAVAVAKLIEPADGRLAVTLTDERFGPVGHSDSNWQQLLDSSFDIKGAKLLPVLQAGLALKPTTERFATNLQSEFENSDIKVALFGIGADGHIAGILPNSPAIQSDGWATSYQAAPYTRITMTFQAISQLDQAWLYFETSEKLPAVEKLDTDPLLQDEPAAILKQLPQFMVYYKRK